MATSGSSPTSASTDALFGLVDPSDPLPLPAATELPIAESSGAVEEGAAAVPESTPAEAPAPVKPRRGFGGFFRKRAADAVKTAEETANPPAVEEEGEKPKPVKPRRRRSRRQAAMSSWGVSMIVHVVVLVVLGLVTFSSEVRRAVVNINSALVTGNKGGPEELVHVYADARSNERSTEAVGNENADSAGGSAGGVSGGMGGGIGTGAPSATPRVGGVGTGVSEKSSLPGVRVMTQVSGLNLLPAASKLGTDLGGGGMISGDVTHDVADIGTALDQLAREILRHLGQHKLTVVWLFDESESMKDDQKAIKEKFDRITSELKLNVDPAKKAQAALNHAIVGFGKNLHFELEKPTFDIDKIGQAISRLKVDDSGVENTMHAVAEVINHYSGVIRKDRRLLIVLVTDESGDDGDFVEEAHQAAMSRGVPIYVIGRQSLFGLEHAHLRYVDPITKEVFWPAIRRGPETAALEVLQWDGLHNRRDEQPSGFAPYELARLAKDTGGIYFLLPSEETMRIFQREKNYSMADMKELVPDYSTRADYIAKRDHSELRRTLHEIITTIKNTSYRDGFSINPEEMVPSATEAIAIASARLTILLAMQKKLESIKLARDRETEKRWQAHYDLMLAQIVAYQIKAYEYRYQLEQLIKTRPRPKATPTPTLSVWWAIGHSKTPAAPKEFTAKKYTEAERLFKDVIARYPKTPWADLAQDELNRGFSIARGEAHATPHKSSGREKFVPKY